MAMRLWEKPLWEKPLWEKPLWEKPSKTVQRSLSFRLGDGAVQLKKSPRICQQASHFLTVIS
jgi:hypothetical protein